MNNNFIERYAIPREKPSRVLCAVLATREIIPTMTETGQAGML